MLLVYVAAPEGDLRKALLMCEELWNDGFSSHVPLLSRVHDLVSPRPAEEWLAINLDMVRRCDVLLRMPGESVDADCAVVTAKEYEVPVFYTYMDLYKFTREGAGGE